MVAESQLQIRTHWWLAAIPGLAIVAIGCSIAILGDQLRRRLEERS
jgi:peptide/nickel transport system permease protein